MYKTLRCSLCNFSPYYLPYLYKQVYLCIDCLYIEDFLWRLIVLDMFQPTQIREYYILLVY
nr:MAG TPA: hypothetical protein [Bacteriophage sp.]